MRIHRLDIEAFGPFPLPVSVDLDALSDAGLFLLTGATGAGKTSVLDAICFALYGAVPGDRQQARRLRCDRAAPEAVPRVVMEFSVGGRRFRIDRSPSWQRPKRRGVGTTTEQARVLVTERVDGEWQPRATRLDEAGHLVTGLLGMNLTQFCQVQMLPQGRFQAFLRADSKERHQLLQQLFRTSRFEDVELWLRDRRRVLRREATRHHERVADLLSRISETADVGLPDGWDPHALDQVVEQLGSWSDAQLAEAVDARKHAGTAVAAATREEAAARTALEEAHRDAERRERLRQARADRASLLAERGEQEQRRTRLRAARRAAGVTPLRQELARVAAERARAEREVAAASARLAELLDAPPPPAAALATRERELLAQAARAEAGRPLHDEQLELARRTAALSGDITGTAAAVGALDDRLQQLPDELVATRASEDEARAAAGPVETARATAEAATELVAAGRLVISLAEQLTAAQALHREAVDNAQDLREQWLGLQEQRLGGMAAEIAGGLAVGGSCPVCGSREHPQPARPAPDAPDAAREREARRAVDDAEAARHAHAGAVRDLEIRIGHARERTGDRPLSVLEAEADRCARLVTELQDAAAPLPGLVAAREALEREQRDLTTQREELRTRQAALEAALTEQRRRSEVVAAELAGLLDGTGRATVAELADHLGATAAACGEARSAADTLAHLVERHDAASARALDAARAAGFDSLAQATSAELPESAVSALEELIHDYELRLGAVEAVLADVDLRAAEHAPEADLPGLTTAHETADAALAEARTARADTERRADRLRGLHDDLTAALARWAPVRTQVELADRMASLTDGTSADNRLRMRLSGYVLAFRLRQVVAAANERLVTMTDRRYRLEHTGDRGAGETRGGLSLLVRDDWSGEARDPVTLSGGETFVVSLALALGLADVIAHEAGGSELDTLFVDEGFGSLDAETLDDVMDTLDQLRDGGRVVGVVSHVAEMRDRIPAQLQVRKARHGSTLHQEGVG